MTVSKRNVVFVSQRFPPDKGGNAARIHDIATHLDGHEWDVTVLSPPPSYPPGEFERNWRRKRTDTVDGITVHRLWSWQPQTENPSMALRMAYYLLFGIHALLWLLWNVRRYDVVVTTTPPISTGAPGLLAAVLGKPWIVDVRDLWIDASISLGYLEKGSLIERISRRFQRRVLHTADRIAVTTESLGDLLQDTYGESLSRKTILIPNGVDTDRFRPGYLSERTNGAANSNATTDAESDVKAVNNDRKPVTDGSNAQTDGRGATIIYTGNLGTAQDLESCIRAMSHLSSHGATLRLVGRGDSESELRRLTNDLGLQNRVEFVGVVPREEVPALLADATVGIAPLKNSKTFAYAMPTKVYEYLASGLPTVVTGQGEIERFAADSGGCLHAENDPEKIAERFDTLLADEELRRQCAERGREHVKQYDRKVIARRFGDELSQLVENDVHA